MSDTTYIDPLELPFTRDEVFEAVRLWTNDVEAAELIHQFAETAQIDIQNRAERRERLLMAGVDDGGDRTNFRWLTPGWLLPTLSVLSDDCAVRVSAFMEPYWQRRLEGRIEREVIGAAERAGLRPTHAEMLAALAQHGIHPGDRPGPESGPASIAINLPPLPAPTPENIAAAERLLDEDRRRWNALVDEARERLTTG
jgi:hypothetical protein